MVIVQLLPFSQTLFILILSRNFQKNFMNKTKQIIIVKWKKRVESLQIFTGGFRGDTRTQHTLCHKCKDNT